MSAKIGTISTDGIPGSRDAQHVAVVLAVAIQDLRPGDRVRFTDKSFSKVYKVMTSDGHGIVDPFIPPVAKGEKFWVFLRPNSTKNLTHNFIITIDDVANVEIEDRAEYIEDGSEDDYGCRGCY